MEDRKLELNVDIKEVLRMYNQACFNSDREPIDTMDFLMVISAVEKAWTKIDKAVVNVGYSLKSIFRIRNMIEEGKIKKIYLVDFMYCNRHLAEKIVELFGDEVKVINIDHRKRSVDGISFEPTDCILFYETIINNLDDEVYRIILSQARIDKAYVKVLSEDVY